MIRLFDDTDANWLSLHWLSRSVLRDVEIAMLAFGVRTSSGTVAGERHEGRQNPSAWQHHADLRRRLEALEWAAMKGIGQEIETGTATAIEITKRQLAEVEEAIARCRESHE
jgi:hypothetical protein